MSRVAHVLTLFCCLVEASASPGIGQIATQAKTFEPVKNLFGLSVGQNYSPIVIHMNEEVWRERIARLNHALGMFALTAQAKDNARSYFGLGSGCGSADAQRQAFQLARIGCAELR